MFWEYRVIDNILHVRYSPNGEFEECSKQQITARYQELQTELQRLKTLEVETTNM